jgi:hypothetical protein
MSGSGSSFVKPTELCSGGPVAARSPHDAAAATGVLVPGAVILRPAYRTNRVSILDAIDQPPPSRNVSQNQIARQFTHPNPGLGDRPCPAVDGASPHVCRSLRPFPTGMAEVPLLPPIDPAATCRSPLGRCPRTRYPTWPAATPPAQARSTASNRTPPTNHHRQHPRRRLHPPPRHTRFATGNRPLPGAAPTSTASVRCTAPWTRRTAEQPTSTAEFWNCWPTNEQQRAIFTSGRVVLRRPGLLRSPAELPTQRSAELQHRPSQTVDTSGRRRIHRRRGAPLPSHR